MPHLIDSLIVKLHVSCDDKGNPVFSTDFAGGDVVRLNSGGPKMTVAKITEDIADVQWFDGAILQSARLRKDALCHA